MGVLSVGAILGIDHVVTTAGGNGTLDEGGAVQWSEQSWGLIDCCL